MINYEYSVYLDSKEKTLRTFLLLNVHRLKRSHEDFKDMLRRTMQYGINFNFRKCELYQLISARDQGSKILKTQFFMFTAIQLKL